jgi:hypothetical protein
VTSDILYILSFVLIFVSFVLHCFAERSPEYIDFEGEIATTFFSDLHVEEEFIIISLNKIIFDFENW